VNPADDGGDEVARENEARERCAVLASAALAAAAGIILVAIPIGLMGATTVAASLSSPSFAHQA